MWLEVGTKGGYTRLRPAIVSAVMTWQRFFFFNAPEITPPDRVRQAA